MMGDVILNIIIMSVVGAVSGAVIKFLQWVIADVTFGILLGFPTSESIVRLILICTIIGAILGLINGISGIYEDSKREKIWIDTSEIKICYLKKPPHFRYRNSEIGSEFFTCGFCKFFDSEDGCQKYGVKTYGLGSGCITVCDDFKSSLKND